MRDRSHGPLRGFAWGFAADARMLCSPSCRGCRAPLRLSPPNSWVPFLENGLEPVEAEHCVALTTMRTVPWSPLVQCDYVQVTRKGTHRIATRADREMNDLSRAVSGPRVQHAYISSLP